MKILSEMASIVEQQVPKSAQNSFSELGRSFSDALAQELEGAPAAVSEVQSSEIVTNFLGGGDSQVPEEWYQINGVVDSMDRYGEALGDPTYTLKELEPLALEMENQAASLSSQLEESGSFGSLREVAEEVVAQAQIAAIKFRRGDYI